MNREGIFFLFKFYIEDPDKKHQGSQFLSQPVSLMLYLLDLGSGRSLVVLQIDELFKGADLQIKFSSKLSLHLFCLESQGLIQVKLSKCLVELISNIFEERRSFRTDESEQLILEMSLVSIHYPLDKLLLDKATDSIIAPLVMQNRSLVYLKDVH
jgi:hypothetical protein